MKHPSRRSSFTGWKSLAGLAACVVAGLAVAGAPRAHAAGVAAAKTAPNIVFILADDLGYGDVRSLNPEGKIATPNLDRLAAGGMAFTSAFSTSAVCTPSRYSILTGRYAWRSTLKQSVLGGFSAPLLETGRLTVAEFLRRSGYYTAVVGKWHLGLDWPKAATAAGNQGGPPPKAGAENLGRGIDFARPFGGGPMTLGFDEFFGISASLDMPPYTFLEADRVKVVPTKDGAFPWVGSVPAGKQTRTGPLAAGFDAADVLPAFTQRAIDIIERRSPAARDGKPFFLYLPLNSPHTPLAPTQAWRGKSGLNDYADFVMQTDAAVGAVLDALERQGLAANTLVIFTSDNGCSPEADYPFLTGRGHDPSAGRRGHKADIFDGGSRIPLLVRWPARIAAGRRSDALVSLGDFMATCADILETKLPENAAEDSISFLPVLLGRAGAAPRQSVVMHSINGSFALRQGQWKLALCADSGGWSFPRPGRDSTAGLPRFQLYNLAADPAEAKNLAEENPAVVRELGRQLREIVTSGRSTPGRPQPNTPAPRWPQIAPLEEFR